MIEREFTSRYTIEPAYGLPKDHISHFLPDVDFAFGNDIYQWHDPVWGGVDLSDWGETDEDYDYSALFKELFIHPAIRRTIAIEQLTLPSEYATMPNADRFSRWEHASGSGQLVCFLINEWNERNQLDKVTPREKAVYILRALLSDVAHTLGSHLGDWMDDDETETKHDQELQEYLKALGVETLLERYGIALDEVCLTSVHAADFVECPSPDLCVDRVDYGIREIHRTNEYFQDEEHRFTANDFHLVKDASGILQIVMPDVQKAIIFSKAFELLPREDWAEPLQSIQTRLYTDLAKLVILAIKQGYFRTGVGDIERASQEYGTGRWVSERNRHYRDIMLYGEAEMALAIRGLSMNIMDDSQSILNAIRAYDITMKTVAAIAKDYMQSTRSAELGNYLHAVAADPENWKQSVLLERPRDYTAIDPSTDLRRIQLSEQECSGANVLSLFIPPRKRRAIDPVTFDANGREASVSRILPKTQSLEPYTPFYAGLHFQDPRIPSIIETGRAILKTEWPKQQLAQRLSGSQLAELVKLITMMTPASDYWKFTRAGSLLEEEWAETLRTAESLPRTSNNR